MDNLSPEKACFIVVKAREFDVKVEPVNQGSDSGSNPADDSDREILEDFADDPTYSELIDAIDTLNYDESVELVALVWLGRGDFTIDDWEEAVSSARDAHNNRTAQYLAGMPLLADYLEEGLSLHGESCDEFEMGRL